jgi:hypothetical protein
MSSGPDSKEASAKFLNLFDRPCPYAPLPFAAGLSLSLLV